jgi:hypothetical protein
MSSPDETEPARRREWSEQQTVHSPVLPAQDARQATTGHNARYVLGFGVAAVVIVFMLIWLVYFA